MKVRFHTNLDEAQNDVFELNRQDHHPLSGTSAAGGIPIVPRVGEKIRFNFTKQLKSSSHEFSYSLEVYTVTYDFQKREVSVELHMPSHQSSMSIADWTKWFNKHRYGKEY